MKFTKMHGCGNDYVYINGFEETIPMDKKPDFVRFASDRHKGIGGDGVIFINPSDVADFEMEMWNADGTRSEMCGNGIRCVGKYVYDHGLTRKTELDIISGGQIKQLILYIKDKKVEEVRVNMGEPILAPVDIPVNIPGYNEAPVLNAPLEVENRILLFSCVSMGNPHAITYVEDVYTTDVEGIGSKVEKHPAFPNRVNAEFVHVEDRGHIQMRVWERGTGETLACGTGACASVVASILNGLTDNEVEVTLLGGRLKISWEGIGAPLYMTGPAEEVFEGSIEYK